jgi:DNA-binding response OmpR family regulator
MKHILIAEDEPLIASFLVKGLERNGYKTAIAINGEQTLLMMQNNPFDLLLLDIGLPDQDGWTVLKKLHNQGKKIPVIIVTANDDIDNCRIINISQINDYFVKPFRFYDLLQRIQLILTNNK